MKWIECTELKEWLFNPIMIMDGVSKWPFLFYISLKNLDCVLLWYILDGNITTNVDT